MRNELPDNVIEMKEENKCKNCQELEHGSIIFVDDKHKCRDCDRDLSPISSQPNSKPDFSKDQWNSQIDAMIVEIESKKIRMYQGFEFTGGYKEGLDVAQQILLTYKK